MGRILGTTTLYNRGWVKSQVYDQWVGGNKDFEVVQFPSFINPSFPKEEYDRIVRVLPAWKVNMFYRGEFDVPAGLIYDSFNEELCSIKPFRIPDHWPRFGMMDFGGVNTAAINCALDEKNKIYYLIDEYWIGGRTAQRHTDELLKWGCRTWWGGAPSEDQWRLEFRQAGLNIQQPAIADVEVGINRVYGAHAEDRIFVFDTLVHYLDQKGTYRRELDSEGQPTEKIANKSEYHIMDAERYGIGTLERKKFKAKVVKLG
jgi:hypothetical protein